MTTVLASQLDPVGSALDSIAAHFQGLLPGLEYIRGPQEFPVTAQVAPGVVSLVAIDRQWEEMPTTEVGPGRLSGTTLYKVAQLTIRGQMDLWLPYRVTASVIAAFQEQQFHNRLPQKAGLELESIGYWSRPLTVHKVGGSIDQRSPDDAIEGLNRRTWDLEILTDLVVPAAVPEAVSVSLLLTTELGPDTVVEPDYTVPAP